VENNLLEPIIDLIWEPEETPETMQSGPPMEISCVLLCGGGIIGGDGGPLVRPVCVAPPLAFMC